MNMPVREGLPCKSDFPALGESALQPLEMRFRIYLHEQICNLNPTGAYSKRNVIANLSKGALLRHSRLLPALCFEGNGVAEKRRLHESQNVHLAFTRLYQLFFGGEVLVFTFLKRSLIINQISKHFIIREKSVKPVTFSVR